MKFLVLALFLAFVAATSAQVPYFRKCPAVPVQENFNAESYLGLWYEYEKYPHIFEIGGKCITAEYSLRPDGKVGVHNKMFNRLTGSETTITGYAVPDVAEPAKLAVTFPSFSPAESPYWVLGTDYETYSVVWSCSEWAGLASTRIVWILTREQVPSIETIEKAYAVLDRNGISKTPLIKTDHDGCNTMMQRGN